MSQAFLRFQINTNVIVHIHTIAYWCINNAIHLHSCMKLVGKESLTTREMVISGAPLLAFCGASKKWRDAPQKSRH